MGWIDQTRPDWVLARPPRVTVVDEDVEGDESSLSRRS